jgi:hypothetical protein
MSATVRIAGLVQTLLTEGEAVLSTKFLAGRNTFSSPPKSFVDLQAFAKWRASCRLLINLLGDLGTPWKEALMKEERNLLGVALSTQGTLQAIQAAINDDLLLRFEDLVFAEAFADLMEQAEYLLEQGYFLASGVLLRAVLEERLKRLCGSHSVETGRERPTINDYNQALYTKRVYDKVTFKQVDTMAAVGNDAAHNNSDLTKPSVEHFRRDLTEFLQRFAV